MDSSDEEEKKGIENNTKKPDRNKKLPPIQSNKLYIHPPLQNQKQKSIDLQLSGEKREVLDSSEEAIKGAENSCYQDKFDEQFIFVQSEYSRIFNQLQTFSLENIEKLEKLQGKKQIDCEDYFKLFRPPNFDEQTAQDQNPNSLFIKENARLSILTITWNLHGQNPKKSLGDVFQVNKNKHDIIVLATQQCLRSIPASFCIQSKAKWESALNQELGSAYSVVKSQSMNAMHLSVYAQQHLLPYLRDVRTETKATGIAGIVGNKGGIAISFKLGNKSLLFVNCHLSSGQDKSERRDQDFKKIHDNINPLENQKTQITESFDYIFWMGDFNFRVEESSFEVVEESYKNQQYLDLLKKDQFLIQKSKKSQLYSDFEEGLIMFSPSYKLSHLKDDWDRKAVRIPGWTDRIIWYQKEEGSVEQRSYDSITGAKGSDHRPVFSQFLVSVTVQIIDPNNVAVKVADSGCSIF